jgi:DNA-binding transcriptional LysR family regulator
MLSLKQLEAVYWVARLGTFGAAAERLFTTQSAISKRVNELEFFLQIPLFDRSRRSVQLTAKGRELLEGAEEMLQLRDRLLERMGKEVEIVRRFRLGITELIALTFLPRLVQDIRLVYPMVSLEPEIDVSANLVAKLARGDIDFIIAPSVMKDPRFTAVPLKKLQLKWMCSPTLVANSRALSLDEIANYPILMQIGTSGVDALYERWFRSRNIAVRRTFAGNSLIALSSLTVAGFGVSYLPALYFSDLVSQGLLHVLRATEPLPAVRYYGIYRNDGPLPFYSFVADLTRRLCDFSKPSLAPAAR